MPMYKFGCGSCEVLIERLVAFHDPPPSCKTCGQEMKRQFPLPAPPVFCGPGTYATDYGNMAHHLKPYDQRVRAGNECHRYKLQVARPGPTDPKTANEIAQLHQQGGVR